MAEYEMEELLPILAELTRKYTSGESTSVTYERSQSLMEGILYGIRECKWNEERDLPAGEKLPAEEAYRIGMKRVEEKTKKAMERYHQLIAHFCDYGNENYRDTVTRALPGFFQNYDARFAPQETIITMDYPLLCPLFQLSGIDAIDAYVRAIEMEQQFFGAFPEEYIRYVLEEYDSGYQKQFYNLCQVFLRHILGKWMIEQLGTEQKEEPYLCLEQIVFRYRKEELEKILRKAVDALAAAKWEKQENMAEYLKGDIKDFVSELFMGAQNKCLKRIVVC